VKAPVPTQPTHAALGTLLAVRFALSGMACGLADTALQTGGQQTLKAKSASADRSLLNPVVVTYADQAVKESPEPCPGKLFW